MDSPQQTLCGGAIDVPDGWQGITEGNTQTGDMCFIQSNWPAAVGGVPTNGTWQTIAQDEVGESVWRFVAIIRKSPMKPLKPLPSLLDVKG